MNWLIVNRAISLEEEAWTIAVPEIVQVNPSKINIISRLLGQASSGLGCVMLEAHTLNKLHPSEICTGSKITQHASYELGPSRSWNVQSDSLVNMLLITPILN